MFKYFKSLVLSLIILSLAGCPAPVEPVENILLLKNKSNQKIQILLNLSYPDSLLKNSFADKYVNPNSSGYLGDTLPLRSQGGITIILFEYEYYYSKWNKDVGTPDTYLEESRILQRYVLSRRELESLSWIITYP